MDLCDQRLTIMRTRLLTSLLLGSTLLNHVKAQDACDPIVIERVQYSAVHSNYIEVLAYVTNSDCIDYPSFILLNDQGDTLAVEATDFFCLSFGTASAHYLAVRPEAQIPTGSFNARLDLYTGFGASLVCSWVLNDVALCPTEPCTQAEIYLTNTGPLETFAAFWWIYDSGTSEQIANGNFLAGETATNFDTTCLAPGHYVIEFSPFSPIDEEYVMGITNNWQYSIGTNVAQQGDTTPLDLVFSWYEACVDVGNSVNESASEDIGITLQNNLIQVNALSGRALGRITMHTLDGRLVEQRYSASSSASLSTDGLSAGIFIIQAVNASGHSFVQRIFIP